jgi:hypothetical protein
VPTVTSSACPGRIARPQKARNCSGIERPEGKGNRCTTRSVSPTTRPLGSLTPCSSRAANTPGSHSRSREVGSPASEDPAALLPSPASRPGSALDLSGMRGMVRAARGFLCTSGARRSNQMPSRLVRQTVEATRSCTPPYLRHRSGGVISSRVRSGSRCPGRAGGHRRSGRSLQRPRHSARGRRRCPRGHPDARR